MKKFWKVQIILIAILLLVAGCSSNDDNKKKNKNDSKKTQETVGTTDKEKNKSTEQLYHEIGETFEMTAYYADAKAEITVNKVWTEPGEQHKEYIEENLASPDEDTNVTFIDFTVKNKSDKQIGLGDLLPEYTAANTEVDVSYPKNDKFTDFLNSFKYEVEPGEELDLVGAVATSKEDKYTSAFLWNITQEVPEVVFHTPQSERKDKIGIYDIGEAIYPIDHGEEGYLKVTINDITIEKEAKGLNHTLDNSSYLVLDVEFENTLKEEQPITAGIPSAVIKGDEVPHTVEFSLDGKWIDVYHSADAYVQPGKTLKGKVYLEISNDDIEKVNIYYFNPALLIFPEYSMKLNYNL